jgi:hypothetical protein
MENDLMTLKGTESSREWLDAAWLEYPLHVPNDYTDAISTRQRVATNPVTRLMRQHILRYIIGDSLDLINRRAVPLAAINHLRGADSQWLTRRMNGCAKRLSEFQAGRLQYVRGFESRLADMNLLMAYSPGTLEVVEFNVILPTNNVIHEMELPIYATIGDVLLLLNNLLREHGLYGTKYVRNVHDDLLDSEMLIKDVREPRDLFIVQSGLLGFQEGPAGGPDLHPVSEHIYNSIT